MRSQSFYFRYSQCTLVVKLVKKVFESFVLRRIHVWDTFTQLLETAYLLDSLCSYTHFICT